MPAHRSILATVSVIVLATSLIGCGGKKPPMTGFLSDYSRLESINKTKMRYVSSRLSEYEVFIVDPVELRRRAKTHLTDEQRTEAAQYFRQRLIDTLVDNGYRVVDVASTGVARVRMALTDIEKGIWWMNLHPGLKLTGAGTGGASMEGEVIDSVTGEQLAAVVKCGRGNQFELDMFSGLDDIKDVIDRWAKEAVQALRELREANGRL